MTYFAEIRDGIVINVLLAERDVIVGFQMNNPDSMYIQTDINTRGNSHRLGGKPLRANFAAIGGTYDEQKDVFIPPKEHESYVLNTQTYQWEAPILYPEDGLKYTWDEAAYQADTNNPKTAGWVEVTNNE
jgi:hypothetical protein